MKDKIKYKFNQVRLENEKVAEVSNTIFSLLDNDDLTVCCVLYELALIIPLFVNNSDPFIKTLHKHLLNHFLVTMHNLLVK
jgi:hypothetical protein